MSDDAEGHHTRDDSDHSRRSTSPPDAAGDFDVLTADDQTDGRPAVDGLYRLCADRDRRHVLYHLDESDGALPIGELATRLARRPPGEHGDTEREGTSSGGTPSPAASGSGQDAGSDPILTSLHHVHLPKLADAGAVSYDQEAGEVVPSIGERLSAVLDGARSLECSGAAEGR